MRVLAVHRNFHGQFAHLVRTWSQRPGWEVGGLGRDTAPGLPGFNVLARHKPTRGVRADQHANRHQAEKTINSPKRRQMSNFISLLFLGSIILISPANTFANQINECGIQKIDELFKRIEEVIKKNERDAPRKIEELPQKVMPSTCNEADLRETLRQGRFKVYDENAPDGKYILASKTVGHRLFEHTELRMIFRAKGNGFLLTSANIFLHTL